MKRPPAHVSGMNRILGRIINGSVFQPHMFRNAHGNYIIMEWRKTVYRNGEIVMQARKIGHHRWEIICLPIAAPIVFTTVLALSALWLLWGGR